MKCAILALSARCETNKTGEGIFAFNSSFRLLLSNLIFDTASSDFEIGYQLYLFDRKAKQVQFIVRYNSFFIKLQHLRGVRSTSTGEN